MAVCQVPSQLLDPAERAAQLFINTNARVDDPVAELAAEQALRPWTPEEKRVFNEKFLAHPKVCPCAWPMAAACVCHWLGLVNHAGMLELP